MTPRSALAAMAVLSAAGAHATAAQTYLPPDSKAVAPINTAILAGNCQNAVALMKSGVKAKQPDVLLVAGTMFENGTCLKPDWDKAVTLYQLADKAGNYSATARLMAGFAHPGRDNGLAIWWAAQRGMNLGKHCETGAGPDSTEAFNAGLERMLPEVFRACVYTAGVLGEVIAQGYFPQAAARHGISGKVRMAFKPAAGTITWTQNELIVSERQHYGVRDLAKEGLENPRAIKNSLVTYLKSKGEYALSRYQKPAGGFDPELVIQSEFLFRLEE